MANKPRKSKRPWDPAKNVMPENVAKDLGITRRLDHSKAGFEPELVGIGHFRLREKAMLTDPALLSERANAKMRAYVESGKEPDKDIQISQTPSDRATAMWRNLLWSYMHARYKDVSGKIGSTNFEKSSHSSDLNRLPLTDNQFSRLKFYNWLRKQPIGLELSNFLNDIAAQCNPQAHPPEHKIMSKTEIGAWLIDSDTPRDCKSATDGALALACRLLAGAQAQFFAQERQEKIAKKRHELT